MLALSSVVAVTVLGAACGRSSPPPVGAMDVTGATWGRDFRLQDPSGAWRTLADYRGKAVMVFFGFTQCPDICPAALAQAVEVLQALGDEGRQVQVLFVSLDPERDTPDILRAFAATFHPSFVPLRGDLELTRRTAEEFKVFFRKVPQGGSYTLDHSAYVYLYDRAGRLRRTLLPRLGPREQAAQVRELLQST